MWLPNFQLHMWFNYTPFGQHWSRLSGKCPLPKCQSTTSIPFPHSSVTLMAHSCVKIQADWYGSSNISENTDQTNLSYNEAGQSNLVISN